MLNVRMKVSGQSLEKDGEWPEIVRGTNNYVCVHISPDSEWRNRKSIVVSMKNVSGYVVNKILRLSGGMFSFFLPEEITQESRVYIKLYGTGPDGLKVSTEDCAIEQS